MRMVRFVWTVSWRYTHTASPDIEYMETVECRSLADMISILIRVRSELGYMKTGLIDSDIKVEGPFMFR